MSGLADKLNTMKVGVYGRDPVAFLQTYSHCVAMKSDMQSMEYPYFSISTIIDKKPRELVIGDETLIIEPGPAGRPTIWDKDILLYCVSHIAEGINRGERVSRTVRTDSYALLCATNRGTGGNSYTKLVDAVKRLKGTQYYLEVKNPERGVKRQLRALEGFIDEAVVTEYDDKKRAISIDITLSENFYLRVCDLKNVLTLSPEYYQVRKGVVRRLYELARKFCGKKCKGKTWAISLAKLQERTGSTSTLRKFRAVIKDLAEGRSTIPEYGVSYDQEAQKDKGGRVTFYLLDP